jgi:hypothetical protein
MMVHDLVVVGLNRVLPLYKLRAALLQRPGNREKAKK